jgi:leucyl-tRNA synthetase
MQTEVLSTLQRIQDDSQKKWKDMNLFEARADPENTLPKVVITTPDPYVDSLMSMNRGFAFVMCDIYANYQALQGKNILFSLGFQLSGTKIQVFLFQGLIF